MSEREIRNEPGGEPGSRDAWLDALERSYRPEPLDGAAAARFDARLRERIERDARGGWRRAGPPLGAALATVALAALVWVGGGSREPRATPEELADWEWELWLGVEDEASLGLELPEDYAALSSAFLEY